MLGEDDTVVGMLPRGTGTSGEAMAPSDPGLLGSATHFSNGAPHRNGFCPKEDWGKPDSDFGISPERRFPETLRSCRPGRFTSGMRPENRLSSRRRVRRWVRRLTVAGISPEKLLCDRSRRYRRKSDVTDAGNSPENSL